MRLISFSETTQQIRDQSKDVTRRLGWRDLKPGTLMMACEKVMGRQGKPLIRLAIIVVIKVERQPLNLMVHAWDYGLRECVREGFPDLSPIQFCRMFMAFADCPGNQEVTRIEFKYVPGGRQS